MASTEETSFVLADRRRRRWAPKVRTGCIACRTRRVKCDEAQPACKRCLSTGRWCEYQAIIGSTSQYHLEQSSWEQNKNVTSEYPVVPPDWDFQEACRYFLQVILPARPDDIENQKTSYTNFSRKYRPGFIFGVVARRICHVSRAQNVLPESTELPAIKHLWAKYHEYVLLNIQDINKYLEDLTPANKEMAFLRITDITNDEIRLVGTSWRAHIIGYLTLARLGDGLDGVLQSTWRIRRSMQFHLVYAVVSNTTGPAHDQIWQVYDFTDEQIEAFYSLDVFGEMPCPTALFLEIIRLTRLRTKFVAGTPRSVILPAMQGILERVNRFSLEDWNEPYTLRFPKGPEQLLSAKIFKSAVALYGVLSLLPYKASQLSRSALREELVGLIKEFVGLNTYNLGLAWPLSVVAVALKDGSSEDKAMIEAVLCGGSAENYFNSPMLYIKRLREFWASDITGLSAWDDCYFRPFPPLA